MIAIFTRRRLLSATVMVVMMLAVILPVGYIASQNGKFPDIYGDKPGDERIVAVVNGIEVPFGEVRKSPEFRQAAKPELTEDEAYKFAIVGNIDRFIRLSEVKRRGLMPSAKEGKEYTETHKESCSAVKPAWTVLKTKVRA